MRTCITCKEEKSDSNFYKNKRKVAGGKKYLTSNCKECEKKRNLATIRKLRQLFLSYKGGKCSICGYDKCYWALELHHRDSKEKEIMIGKLRNFNEKTKNELDKCDLVCSNCHREIHFGQKFP